MATLTSVKESRSLPGVVEIHAAAAQRAAIHHQRDRVGKAVTLHGVGAVLRRNFDNQFAALGHAVVVRDAVNLGGARIGSEQTLHAVVADIQQLPTVLDLEVPARLVADGAEVNHATPRIFPGSTVRRLHTVRIGLPTGAQGNAVALLAITDIRLLVDQRRRTAQP